MTVIRWIVLTALAVPVFTGWFPLLQGGEILPGVTRQPVIVALAVLAGVGSVCGRSFLAGTLAVTALILVPIVYVGGTVSWLLAVLGGASPQQAGALNGAHYANLAINMLGVIPLALALVAAIPFGRLEQRLLRKEEGITVGEKYLLMFVRVFHHIVYFVIPNILEIVREEGLPSAASRRVEGHGGPVGSRFPKRRLTAALVQVGVSGICAALRFIPLWAREIEDLPTRAAKQHGSRK